MLKDTKFDAVLSALITPLENLINKKIKSVEVEIENINTALAAIEKGTIKVLPSGEVKLWELQSGLYRVSSGVTINASQTEILPKPAKPYSYLYVSGESYTGSTDKRYIVGWAYLVSTSYDNRYAAKVFTGATYTNGIARETATEIATVTKLNNLEERLNTNLKDVATKDYVNELFTTLQGNLDEVSSLVGSQTALPPISDDAPIYGGDTRPPVAETGVGE